MLIRQNVFFTLFLGYLAFCALEYFWEAPMDAAFLLCLLSSVSLSCCMQITDGVVSSVLVLMYLLRNEKVSQAIVGSCWLSYEWKACFAFISINMYNGKRGFIRGKAAKYFFYLFYPRAYHNPGDHPESLFSLKTVLAGLNSF